MELTFAGERFRLNFEVTYLQACGFSPNLSTFGKETRWIALEEF
jgi:hypothetical protein